MLRVLNKHIILLSEPKNQFNLNKSLSNRKLLEDGQPDYTTKIKKIEILIKFIEKFQHKDWWDGKKRKRHNL